MNKQFVGFSYFCYCATNLFKHGVQLKMEIERMPEKRWFVILDKTIILLGSVAHFGLLVKCFF